MDSSNTGIINVQSSHQAKPRPFINLRIHRATHAKIVEDMRETGLRTMAATVELSRDMAGETCFLLLNL